MLIFSLCMLLASLFGAFWDHIVKDYRAPVVEFFSAEALNSPVKPGGILSARIHRQKVRDDCPVRAVRTLMDQDGRSTVISDVVVKGGPAIKEYVDIDYRIPEGIAPGAYVLWVSLTYTCPKLPVFRYTQPPIRFRIVE